MGKKKKGPARTAVELPPHLRLGLNTDAYERFCEKELPKVGWTFGAGNYVFGKKEDPRPNPDTVKAWRSKYPEGLFWIAEQYGDRLTGYDVAEATKMWLRVGPYLLCRQCSGKDSGPYEFIFPES